MGNKIVYTYISGDLLHIGHLRFLEQAKALGDYLIVGVLTDEVIASYKRRPITPLEERLEMVSHIDIVDKAIIQRTLKPDKYLRRYKADVVVHADDWGENFPGAEYMRSIGKQALRVPYYPHQSTTMIIGRIIEQANKV